MHAPRLLLAVLLIAAVALPSARGGVSLVFDITDRRAISSPSFALPTPTRFVLGICSLPPSYLFAGQAL